MFARLQQLTHGNMCQFGVLLCEGIWTSGESTPTSMKDDVWGFISTWMTEVGQ